MTKKYDIALLGATSLTGEAILEHLAERNFPLGKLYLLSASLSVGDEIFFRGKDIVIEDAEQFDFGRVQLALFAAGAEAAAHFAPKAAAAGCVVVDTSPQFRQDVGVPLVVTAVNRERIPEFAARRLIACPNAASMHLLTVLKPIHDAAEITRIDVVTYQAVSGTGKDAITELADQTRAIFNLTETENSVYAKRIAFNVLPQIGALQDNGYTSEEMKMVDEIRKVLDAPTLAVNPTTVRVPVFYGHAQAVHIETKHKLAAQAVSDLLKNAPGLTVIDAQDADASPTPLDATSQDEVLVGRIRDAIALPNGLNLWLVADNIRGGASLNCVKIAEILVESYLN